MDSILVLLCIPLYIVGFGEIFYDVLPEGILLGQSLVHSTY